MPLPINSETPRSSVSSGAYRRYSTCDSDIDCIISSSVETEGDKKSLPLTASLQNISNNDQKPLLPNISWLHNTWMPKQNFSNTHHIPVQINSEKAGTSSSERIEDRIEKPTLTTTLSAGTEDSTEKPTFSAALKGMRDAYLIDGCKDSIPQAKLSDPCSDKTDTSLSAERQLINWQKTSKTGASLSAGTEDHIEKPIFSAVLKGLHDAYPVGYPVGERKFTIPRAKLPDSFPGKSGEKPKEYQSKSSADSLATAGFSSFPSIGKEYKLMSSVDLFASKDSIPFPPKALEYKTILFNDALDAELFDFKKDVIDGIRMSLITGDYHSYKYIASEAIAIAQGRKALIDLHSDEHISDQKFLSMNKELDDAKILLTKLANDYQKCVNKNPEKDDDLSFLVVRSCLYSSFKDLYKRAISVDTKVKGILKQNPEIITKISHQMCSQIFNYVNYYFDPSSKVTKWGDLDNFFYPGTLSATESALRCQARNKPEHTSDSGGIEHITDCYCDMFDHLKKKNEYRNVILGNAPVTDKEPKVKTSLNKETMTDGEAIRIKGQNGEKEMNFYLSFNPSNVFSPNQSNIHNCNNEPVMREMVESIRLLRETLGDFGNQFGRYRRVETGSTFNRPEPERFIPPLLKVKKSTAAVRDQVNGAVTANGNLMTTPPDDNGNTSFELPKLRQINQMERTSGSFMVNKEYKPRDYYDENGLPVKGFVAARRAVYENAGTATAEEVKFHDMSEQKQFFGPLTIKTAEKSAYEFDIENEIIHKGN